MATCPNHVPLNQPKDMLDAATPLHNDVHAQWHFMCARSGSKAGAGVRRKAQGMDVLVYDMFRHALSDHEHVLPPLHSRI